MPYKEGKIGLKLCRIKTSVVLLFCFISSNLYSQFNLNGFYRVQKFETLPGYEKIYQTDFKFNNVPDLVFYTSDKNNVVLHPGKKQFQFDNPIDKFFFYPISSIQEISSNRNENFHVFVSRNDRLAGLVSFTRYGTLQMLNMLEFNSFPSKIIADNFDKRAGKEVIVFGSAFDGISLLKKEKYKLTERSFLQGHSFSEVVSLDLDFDGYNDLIAKDLLENSLLFLYNNHMGGFNVERTWPFDSTFENLKILDFNKDSFDDLFYFTDNGITVCYGDSVFSFNEKYFWPLDEPSDIGIIHDLNRDGSFDFLSYNKSGGNLSLNLNTKSNKKENWFILLNDTSITDINFLEGYENSILVLTDKGEFYTISTITNLDSSLTIPTISTESFTSFYSKNNKIGIASIDTTRLELNLTYSVDGIFDKKKIIPAADKFTSITSARNFNNQTYFTLYSDSLELFQIIDANLKEEDYTDFEIYSEYPILDLALFFDSTSVYPNVHTLVANNDSIGLVKFVYRDFHYISSQFEKISKNVLDAKLSRDSNLVVEYCTVTNDSITINKYYSLDDRPCIISAIAFSIDSVIMASLSSNYCLVTKKNQQYLINTENYNVTEIPDELAGQITDVSLFENEKNKIIAKDNNGAILLLDYNKAENKLSLANYIVSQSVDSYFCTHLLGKKYLIYKLASDDYINFLEFK